MMWHAPSKYFPRSYRGSTVRDGIRWHYTKGVHLPKIAHDGVLDPVHEAFIPDDLSRVLWASTHPVWEATVCIGLLEQGHHRTCTFAETVETVHGVYRIALTPESVPYDFEALADLTAMPPRLKHNLHWLALEKGSSSADWWGTLDPVGQAEWLDVQRWDTQRCDWFSVEIQAEVQRLLQTGLRLGLPTWMLQRELAEKYLGQLVLVGQSFDTVGSPAHEGRYYLLGTIDPEHPSLPDQVLAIIADDQMEAVDEHLSVWQVDPGPRPGEITITSRPLVVFDDRGRLLYGVELLAAAVETETTLDTFTVWGVRLPEPGETPAGR